MHKYTGSPADPYDLAMRIVDGEWRIAGVPTEAFETSAQLAELFGRCLGSGRTVGSVIGEWSQRSVNEILRDDAMRLSVEVPVAPETEWRDRIRTELMELLAEVRRKDAPAATLNEVESRHERLVEALR